ncbi:hypothetical protein SNEBB_007682 [Seison nebaliae]|nr:hypothetical protein SNEBB_007682 [Seison nebaliae]
MRLLAKYILLVVVIVFGIVLYGRQSEFEESIQTIIRAPIMRIIEPTINPDRIMNVSTRTIHPIDQISPEPIVIKETPMSKLYEIREKVKGKYYTITLLSVEVPANYCFSCEVNRESLLRRNLTYDSFITRHKMKMVTINWLNETIVNVIFNFYKMNRYQYFIPQSIREKITLCNVYLEDDWKESYCNHSTNYTQFYCQKQGPDDQCLEPKEYISMNHFSPLTLEETIKYDKLFVTKTFVKYRVATTLPSLRLNVTRRELEVLPPHCSDFYSGADMANYYKSIEMSEDEYSFTEIYQNYLNDITPLGFYLNNLWMYKHCTFNNTEGWLTFYKKMISKVKSFKKPETIRNISLSEHMRHNVENKFVLFLGDSTIRDIIHVAYKMFRLSSVSWIDARNYTYHPITDIFGLNFTFAYQPHGIPVRGKIVVDYFIDIEQQLDDILTKYTNGGKTPSAIVMNYDHQVAPFAYSFYKTRLISICGKIVEVLARIPDLKIMLKGAGKLERIGDNTPYTKKYNPFLRHALTFSTEYVQFMNSRFLHYIWKRIKNEVVSIRRRLIFLNFYSMNEILCKAELNLCEEIVIQQFYVITRYL